IEYAAAIEVEGRAGEFGTTEIKAMALPPDMQDSAVATCHHPTDPTRRSSNLAAPVANPPAGKYTSNQTVTLTSDTPDATIYYTTDGREPTAEDGREYVAPIAVEGREGESVTTEIKAIAVAPDMQDSAVATFRY